MYEELIKQLRNRRMCIQGLGTLNDYPLLGEAADAIEELSRENKEISFRAAQLEAMNDALIGETGAADALIAKIEAPRWIPVTEQPQSKVGDDGYNGYLVYANGYYEIADYTIDKLDVVPYFHVDGEYETDVTHWMPLPEPPKEDA